MSETESPEAQSPAQLLALESMLEQWFADQAEENPVVDAVDRDPVERRWYIRLRGEEKDVYAVWFTMRQRTLHFETYVMPAPEENQAAFYEHLLARNHDLYGMAFSVGAEQAIFLGGALANAHVTAAELDRVLGTVWATIERCFRPALRLGFASRLSGP